MQTKKLFVGKQNFSARYTSARIEEVEEEGEHNG